MNKKAFTLIELVFIIVIIGILASIAIPKFNRLDSTAKINAEISTMNSAQKALQIANSIYTNEASGGYTKGEDNDIRTFDIDNDAKEEEFGDGMLLTLHSSKEEAKFASTSFMDMSKKYAIFNDRGEIFSKVLKNQTSLRVIAYVPASENGIDERGRGDDSTSYDIIAITAQASSRFSGVKENPGGDSLHKPDSNDFWVYNGSPYPIDLNASKGVILSYNHKSIMPGSLVLIDINGKLPKSKISPRFISVQRSDKQGKKLNFRELVQDGYN